MSFRRMTRMVSFRVSENEFEQLRSKSEAEGARSVSDYARLSLCGRPGTSEDTAPMTMQELSNGIQRLSLDIRRLFDLIESPPRNQNGHNAMAAKQNGSDA